MSSLYTETQSVTDSLITIIASAYLFGMNCGNNYTMYYACQIFTALYDFSVPPQPAHQVYYYPFQLDQFVMLHCHVSAQPLPDFQWTPASPLKSSHISTLSNQTVISSLNYTFQAADLNGNCTIDVECKATNSAGTSEQHFILYLDDETIDHVDSFDETHQRICFPTSIIHVYVNPLIPTITPTIIEDQEQYNIILIGLILGSTCTLLGGCCLLGLLGVCLKK